MHSRVKDAVSSERLNGEVGRETRVLRGDGGMCSAGSDIVGLCGFSPMIVFALRKESASTRCLFVCATAWVFVFWLCDV